MIIRIVRMHFREEKTEVFLKTFETVKDKILATEGCQHLELWKEAAQKSSFTTYSHWQDAESLERYRHSELFKATWAKTKVLFSAKPEAISYYPAADLPNINISPK